MKKYYYQPKPEFLDALLPEFRERVLSEDLQQGEFYDQCQEKYFDQQGFMHELRKKEELKHIGLYEEDIYYTIVCHIEDKTSLYGFLRWAMEKHVCTETNGNRVVGFYSLLDMHSDECKSALFIVDSVRKTHSSFKFTVYGKIFTDDGLLSFELLDSSKKIE